MNNNKVLLLSKNDYNGIASAILCRYIFENNLDIVFHNYSASLETFNNIDFNSYKLIIIMGLKNANKIAVKTFNYLIANSFLELYDICKENFPEDFDNTKLNEFYQNSLAYIDWSWNEKGLYYGKNIDDLCKYLNKEEIIELIANRIANKEDIITKTDKDILLFVKKMMTNIIKENRYEVIEMNNKKFAVTYANNYEIELANYILSKEKDNICAVIIINMNTKIARIKAAKGFKLEKEISQSGGVVNSNGGTLKFGDIFDKSIYAMLLNKF